MDIGAHARRARELAALLIESLDAQAPDFRNIAAVGASMTPALEALGVRVEVVHSVPGGCSVAGSCDRGRRSITVVRAAPARMRFTALHELAHLLGDDHDPFQIALYAAAGMTRRAVEEDACEAFAAALLLPDDVVDAVLGVNGLTARGVIALAETAMASREACAVAAAHRLLSPGYVSLVTADGRASFTARSGDAFNIVRGTPQRGSVLDPVLAGRSTLRDRGELLYASGMRTAPHYVDAAVGTDGVAYVVAATDQPDWEVLHIPDRTVYLDRALEGRCDRCEVDFTGSRQCNECGEPVHDLCSGCACPPRSTPGARTCSECFTVKPAGCFPDDSNVCEEHPRPR